MLPSFLSLGSKATNQPQLLGDCFNLIRNFRFNFFGYVSILKFGRKNFIVQMMLSNSNKIVFNKRIYIVPTKKKEIKSEKNLEARQLTVCQKLDNNLQQFNSINNTRSIKP